MPAGFFHGSRLAQSKEPPSLVPRCSACGLYKTCITPKMPVSGEGRRRILVVAEAPGANEDEEGAQLIGDAGKLLRKYLRRVDIDLDIDCWKTNALICRPPKNRTPDDDEIAYCRPNLLNTIKALQPDVIIPLGGIAVKSLIGPLWQEEIGPVARWVGWRIPDIKLNSWICPTWHPSFLLHTEDKDDPTPIWFERHLAAAAVLEGKPWPDGPPDYKRDIKLIYDPDEAVREIDKIAAVAERQQWRGMLAYDYECDRLKPDNPDRRLVCCSLAYGMGPDPRRVIAYPWSAKAKAATGRLLRTPVGKVASNLKFEERWTLAEFGHGARNWFHDTMQDAHVLDNRQSITSVKFQSYVRCGFPAYNAHIEPYLRTDGDQTVNRILQEIALSDLLLYNAIDSAMEYRVAVAQRRESGRPLPWEMAGEGDT